MQQMLPTAGLAESYACGEMVQSDRSMKQEPTEGIALSQREPVGIPALKGGEDVNSPRPIKLVWVLAKLVF